MLRIKLVRDFVGAADDYANSGEKFLLVPETASTLDFLNQVLRDGYLQTSSSNQCLVAVADKEIALVVPDDEVIIPLVDLANPVSIYTANNQVSFSFSLNRQQQRAYAEYRMQKFKNA